MYVVSFSKYICWSKVSTAALSASSPYPAVLHDPQASTSSSYVTPALSAKVQLAAETNPTLANLLNAVINRVATDEEVKRLGVLIRQLEDIPDLGSPGIPPPSPTPPIPVRAVSPKPFDLILEFHEKPSDRWTLPRGDVFCERVGVAEGAWARYADVIITTCITPSGGSSELATSDEPLPDSLAPDVVSLRFSRVPQSLWELLVDWAGGPQKMESEDSLTCTGVCLKNRDGRDPHPELFWPFGRPNSVNMACSRFRGQHRPL